ncbi:MAG TPA: hypothetical protein VIV56_06130 [Gemmatimonadales bacterium]
MARRPEAKSAAVRAAQLERRPAAAGVPAPSALELPGPSGLGAPYGGEAPV